MDQKIKAVFVRIESEMDVTKEEILGRNNSEYLLRARLFVIRYFKEYGLSYEEIGKIMQRTPRAISNLWSRYGDKLFIKPVSPVENVGIGGGEKGDGFLS